MFEITYLNYLCALWNSGRRDDVLAFFKNEAPEVAAVYAAYMVEHLADDKRPLFLVYLERNAEGGRDNGQAQKQHSFAF